MKAHEITLPARLVDALKIEGIQLHIKKAGVHNLDWTYKATLTWGSGLSAQASGEDLDAVLRDLGHQAPRSDPYEPPGIQPPLRARSFPEGYKSLEDMAIEATRDVLYLNDLLNELGVLVGQENAHARHTLITKVVGWKNEKVLQAMLVNHR